MTPEELAEAPAEQPEEPKPSRVARAATAARTGAGAAAAAGRVLAAPAAKAARVAAVTSIVAALLAFLRENRRATAEWLRGELLRRRAGVASPGTPTGGRPGLAGDDDEAIDDVQAVLDEEERREVEFARRQAKRWTRDVTAAVAIPDARDRERAVDGIVRRERVYVRQRTEAMAARAFAAIDRRVLRRESPSGAFWKLDPNVREHTVGCLLLGGKFWPWAVLDRVHPPRHPGCPCRLVSYQEALTSGLMRAGDVQDVRVAVQRAAHVVMEGAFRPYPDEEEGVRALLFEATMIELEDAAVAAGAVQLAEAEQAHRSVRLQLPKPGELAERLESVGLGADPQGFFVYGPFTRSASVVDLGQLGDEQIVKAAGGRPPWSRG